MFKKKPIAACTLFFIIIQDRPVEWSHRFLCHWNIKSNIIG
jgi:hypothetical protein